MNCKNKSFMTKRKAFTLVELLIVIAIIGILFIVLISKVDFATDKSKATGVQTDFRSFQVAIESVAREHAGFNTFGWDTGDLNANGKRDSYDEGDTNKDGKQDAGEVWTGHKVPGETFTKVFSLVKPGTSGYDRDALNKLETAINANLDPKLHITIKDDGEILMANGARDPWNKEYHGWYITNAEVDKKDRGAIVMYSDGANNEFGSEHKISNGIISVSVPGNNKLGKDDYSIAVVYTFVNGYGEVKTQTSGFSNNQATQGNISNNSGTEGTEGTEDPDVTELLEPGLYNAGAIALAENGDVEAAQDMIKTSWDNLLAAGIVHVTNGVVYSNLDINVGGNASSDALDGDLVLPNDGSITSIGDAVGDLASGNIVGNIAFAYCYKLTGITIPKGVTSISDMAFTACSSLTSVAIPNSVTSISLGTFAGCTSLTSVTIPDGVTSIGWGAFDTCTGLASIVIPDSVTYIGENAFIDCDNLQYNEYDNAYYLGSNTNPYLLLVKTKDKNITSINIHNNTRFIHSYAFYRCSNLTSVTIPDGVTNIDEHAFGDCSGITSVIIPNSVTSIGNNAFWNCTSLMSVTIPNSVTIISNSAFHFCSSLTSIEIPNSVTSINHLAFYGCSSLTSITIPDSVTSIDGQAFWHCSSLTSITFNGTKEEWSSIAKQSDWNFRVPATYVQCSDGQVTIK